ncbi:FAD-dependent oxidoreductase [Hydrogenophaga sp. OTU3427]|uniref:FAD-dependent oxidoreductase n=1 Tax=Hydrogenophaga sp. OTU3427 TaxID=3043856 RepID=UPI00313CFAA2
MKTALVIGAGLAGAALVRSLTRLGAQVHWLDAAAGPAAGASALPVGMLSPHITAQPTPLSRLTTWGVAHTRAELERLLPPGQGWLATEVDNLGHDAGRHLAALVRPGALVAAWHAEAQATGRLGTHWNTPVARLRLAANGAPPGWEALDAEGQVLARADAVFVAAAHGSLPLLREAADLDEHALPLRPVKGQLSYGPLDSAPDAERPQRQDGVFVPCYIEDPPGPHAPARLWAMGSTYTRGTDDCAVTEADHARNALSLAHLNPAAAARMHRQQASGALLGWAGVRCASLDRLPLVGDLPDVARLATLLGQPPFHRRKPAAHELPRLPGLYVLTALGSRGLTLASLCAEHLARQAMGTPTLSHGEAPDGALWAALDPARFLWRRLRRQPQLT